MTNLKFKINGTDYSSYVCSNSTYETKVTPVTGTSYTDLNKVNHTTIARWRGSLKVSVQALSPSVGAGLLASLMTAPCTVQYHCFQTNTDVSQTMIPSAVTMQDALERSDGHWTKQLTLEFTEE